MTVKNNYIETESNVYYHWHQCLSNGILIRIDYSDKADVYLDLTFLEKNPLRKNNKRLDKKYGPIILNKDYALPKLVELRNKLMESLDSYGNSKDINEFSFYFGNLETPIPKLDIMECGCLGKCTIIVLRCYIDDSEPFSKDKNPLFYFDMYRNGSFGKKEKSCVEMSLNQLITFLNICVNGLSKEL